MKRFLLVAGAMLASLPVYAMPPQPNLCTPSSPLWPYTDKTFCPAATDLGEPISLSAERNQTVYRLAALPSFKPAFIVRLTGDRKQGGKIEVRAWEKDGRTIHVSSPLTADEFTQLQKSVLDADFWTLPVIADQSLNPGDQKDGMIILCGDGTGWVMEGIKDDAYHLSYSGCAPYDKFDGLAVSIINLAQRKFPEIHLNWDK